MFDAAKEPHFNGGFGIFLLTNPQPGEIWNWKAHCDQGKAEYERHQTEAAKYPETLRQTDPDLYKRLPDYDADELKLETYQSFDTGRYHVPKHSGLFGRNWKWVKDPQGNGFADRCAALERTIHL